MEVDPIDLHVSGARTHEHAADLLAAHGSAHGAAASSRGGWVGASGSALDALLDSWGEFTRNIHGTMVCRGDDFTSSGCQYHATDTGAAATVTKAGDGITSLNLAE